MCDLPIVDLDSKKPIVQRGGDRLIAWIPCDKGTKRAEEWTNEYKRHHLEGPELIVEIQRLTEELHDRRRLLS